MVAMKETVRVRARHGTRIATSRRSVRSSAGSAVFAVRGALKMLAFVLMKTPALLLTSVLLTACATTEAPRPPASPASSSSSSPANSTETHAKSGTQFADAATTPLSDLNLVRADIPPVLAEAQKGAYLVPLKASCDVFAANVLALDEVLGPDLDAPVAASDAGLLERGADVLGNAAVGAFRSAAEGVIPFRSWVRKLTGAERYSREVAAAIAAGTVRRAFLKGLGQAQGCSAPAAPRRPTPEAK